MMKIILKIIKIIKVLEEKNLRKNKLKFLKKKRNVYIIMIMVQN